MSKFRKRVFKSGTKPLNALVIGTGMGRLEEISDMFRTVFIVADKYPDIKLKNIVFRENAFRLDLLNEVTAVFLDRDKVDNINTYEVVLRRHTPTIYIEGDEVIDREKSKFIWDMGFRAVEQQGLFHIWKRIA